VVVVSTTPPNHLGRRNNHCLSKNRFIALDARRQGAKS